MMKETAIRTPSFNPRAHALPFHHVVVAVASQVGSGARMAIITAPSPELKHAMTIFEMVRQTQVTVAQDIDIRGVRFASTWWMQPRP